MGDSTWVVDTLLERLVDHLSPEMIIHNILIHITLNFNQQMILEELISSDYSRSMSAEQKEFLKSGEWKITRDAIPEFILTRLLFGYFRSDPDRTPHQIFSSFRVNWYFVQLNRQKFSNLSFLRSIRIFIFDPSMCDKELVKRITASRHLVNLELTNGSNLHLMPQIGSKKTKSLQLESDTIIDVNALFHRVSQSAKRIALLQVISRADLMGDPDTNEVDFQPLLHNGKSQLSVLKLAKTFHSFQETAVQLSNLRLFTNFDRFLNGANRLQRLTLEILPSVNLIDLQYLPNSLRELSLMTDGCVDPYLRFISERCPNLEVLNLSRARLGSDPNFDNEYCEHLAQIFNEDIMPRLTIVDISGNPSLNNVQCFEHLAKNNTLIKVDIRSAFWQAGREALTEKLGNNTNITLANAPYVNEDANHTTTMRDLSIQ